REWVSEEVRRCIRSGSEFSTEYRIVRPDGSVRWIASRGIVAVDPDGTPLRTLGTVRDVTERREAQAALERLNRTLEQQIAERTAERDRMWRLSGDLFLVIGRRWAIRAVNPAILPLLGYEEHEVLGRRFSDFVHPEDLRDVAGVIRAAGRSRVGDFIARLRSRSGTWRLFSWSAAPAEGEAYVIGRDVTAEAERRDELDLAQEALRQSQKVEALGQLTGGVAHDFNNLLTPILGSLDLLQRNPDMPAREQRLIAGALESAERARVLVQRLLAFARRQPLQPGPVDLADLIQGMAELIDSTSGPQIKVRIEVQNDLPPARGDVNQLEMALLNLSVNARDAMADGGTLTLAASAEQVTSGHRSKLKPGEYLCLSVSDTGSGMDEATAARAIEPFFSTKGVGKGTGLGLSMVHGLASQLGGGMVLSSRPGFGTRVDLYLPISSADPAPRGDSDSPHSTAGAGTVLLVDDEPAVRSSTRELLEDLGYAVVEAESGEKAAAIIERIEVDYLVTDHLMPGMTGTDLAMRVREQRPDIGVLIVSGYAELDGIPPNLRRLAKPFRLEELAQSLASLSASRGARREG
ncbi:MAG: PAS domain S-box protein, partial [Alphaproteobacteria bacterium]